MRTHSRRALLGAGIAVVGSGLPAARALGAFGPGPHSGTDGSDPAPGSPRDTPDDYVSPDGPEVAETERKRNPGPVREFTMTATPARIDLGGRTVDTWAYGDELPGRTLRATAGETLALTLANHLPQSTSVHWHGLALRNDMDGVPTLTQRPIMPGASFPYRFAIPHPGTYWLHPHSRVQQDRGLYAPLIVDDPKEPLSYDTEWVVVFDDWVDGVDGSTPDGVLAELNRGMGGMSGHGGMHGDEDRAAGDQGAPAADGAAPVAGGPSRILTGSHSALLGGDAGDVDYPYHLINGRIAEDPHSFRAKPGDRIRIRFLNAGADTAYRVALGGHMMTVTHADGFPVEHAETEALLLGMGERYDVLVTAKDGVFPLTALAEGKKHAAQAVLRTGSGRAPGASVRPKELDGKLLSAYRLRAAESVRAVARRPDRTVELNLTGSMQKFDWAINGRQYTPSHRNPIRAGERVRLAIRNHTRMWHPVHIHGHHFALPNGGPRKDSAIVLPGRSLDVEFDADNPGLWMVHCHNVYHSESGMMTVLGYRKG
ncbi:multicopper oxidase family protein [Streptomyces sp. NPDC048612]|uniref:multicopper oxidase family protein n=1 Tax=Streptomyces sp. NPDC048612 TaxID=3365579 RepID=UPI0037216998